MVLWTALTCCDAEDYGQGVTTVGIQLKDKLGAAVRMPRHEHVNAVLQWIKKAPGEPWSRPHRPRSWT